MGNIQSAGIWARVAICNRNDNDEDEVSWISMVIMIITVMTVLMMRFCTICSRGPAEWFPLALASSLLPKTINYQMLIVMMARLNMLHQLKLHNFITLATQGQT